MEWHVQNDQDLNVANKKQNLKRESLQTKKIRVRVNIEKNIIEREQSIVDNCRNHQFFFGERQRSFKMQYDDDDHFMILRRLKSLL